MPPAPAAPKFDPVDEEYRLHVLASLGLLDTPPEIEFDALVQLTRQVLDCPIALVSLVDDQRQWFKAKCGIDASETSRDVAFCAHAIRSRGIMVVPDATLDPRFADNPFVTGDPYVRFYAGVPLYADLGDGGAQAPIGTLCVIDTKSRELDSEAAATLAKLAGLAEALVRGRMFLGNALTYAKDLNITAARLARKNRQLAQAERMAGVGSWRMTLADEQLQWSDQVFAIHDLPVGQLPALHGALDFFPPHARATLSGAIAKTLESGVSFDVELDFVSAKGVERRVRSVGEVEMADGAAIALIGVFQDVTEKYRMEQGLRRSASLDALTGIANRSGFDSALDSAIAGAQAQQNPLALLLIDLDGFKQVNDVHGHLAGDELLQGIAGRLEMPYLKGCFPARLGGDEFALIVSQPAACMLIEALADRLLAALRDPVDIGCGSVAVAGTIGICAYEPGMSRRELVHCADLALYEAKRAGKGIARMWRNTCLVESGPERRVSERRRGSLS